MAKGVDLNSIITPAVAKCLYEHQYTFACRYLKHTASCLTRAEVETISQAGMSVVMIVEAGFPTTLGYFSHAKGKEDGTFAYRHAQALGAPAGAAIYFAIDFDPGPAEVHTAIAAYFQGIEAAFLTEGDEHPIYPIGVYGSGLVCEWLAAHVGVTYTWLAMSRGWRGSKLYEGWSIKQTVGAALCGVQVDEDISNGHGGGWKLP